MDSSRGNGEISAEVVAEALIHDMDVSTFHAAGEKHFVNVGDMAKEICLAKHTVLPYPENLSI